MPALGPAQLLAADRSGISPTDTVVEFAARQGRVVVIRHIAPDNAVFAIVSVPPDSNATDRVTLTLRPLPGRYGLQVAATPRLPDGTVLTFSYAIHFQAPAAIPSASYPTAARYAEWLAIGQLQADGNFRYLANTRPGGDLLRAVLPGPGEYLIAAPVTPP